MRRLTALLLVIVLPLASCTQYHTVYKSPVPPQPTTSEYSNYKLKVGIVQNQNSSARSTMTIDSGLYDTVVDLDLEGYLQKSMHEVFSEITLIGRDAPTDKFDVLLFPTHHLTVDDDKIRYGISLKIVDNVNKYILFNETQKNESDYERSSGGGLFFSSLLLPPGFGMPIYIARASGRADRNGVVLEKLIKITSDQLIREIVNSNKMISFDTRKNSPSQHEKQLATAKQEEIVADIDTLPTATSSPRKNRYAVVIGIEKYRQDLQKADYAVRDAKKMAEYLTKVLGYPEENVVVLLNEHAAKSDFEKYFDQWLANNVEKDGTVFVYYSGHGAPNPNNGESFLVPYDGDPTFIDQTGYSLKRLYEALGKLPAKTKIVCLDSCFSGQGGKSVVAKGARPAVFPTETPRQVVKDMIVMTSSKGTQISTSYAEKGHGLFTYFLLKGIKGALEEDKYAKVEVGDLFNYLKPQVERVSRKAYNTEQSPHLQVADETLLRSELR